MIKKRLFNLVQNSKKYIAWTVFVNWICLMCGILIMITAGRLLQDCLYGQAETFTLAVSGAIITGSAAIRFLCGKLSAVISHKAAVNAKRMLRARLYEKILRLGISYSEKVSTSEVIQLSVEGIEQLEIYFGSYLPQLFYSIAAPISLFAVLSFISIKSAAVLLLCVPLIPVSIMFVMKRAKNLFRRYWGKYVNLGDGFLENIQGLTTLKIYDADEYKNGQMNETAEKFRLATMKVLRMQLNSVTLMDIIAYGGSAAGIITAITEFAAGNVRLWGVFSIVMLSSEFFIPLRLLGSLFHTAMNGMSASDKIFEILDMEEQEEKTVKYSGRDIVINDLSFSYKAKRRAVCHINMEIPFGSFTSLVGRSGSGKSTIARLIMGISGNYSGSLKIGAAEVKNISEGEIMRHITMISHNSYIFKGTVRDNLMMGNPGAGEKEMKDALKKANLYDFTESHGGLGFRIEEQGSNLSGGQRQRLALARALLHDSDIYIFDEATSNIDAESEASIMKVIRELAGEKTIVLISHRLENAVDSDMIYVLEGGSVAEKGTHAELVEQDGYYAGLYCSQKNIESYAKGGVVYA